MLSRVWGMKRGRAVAEREVMSIMSRVTDRSAESPSEPEEVTVTVARRVAPGREQEFETWYDGIIGCASRFPGFLGAGILRPNEAGHDWHVVYRFADDVSLHRWEASPERAHWLQKAEEFAEETGVQRVSGLETWFSLPGRTAPAPPKWKMATVTILAIIPLVLLMNVVVLPLLEGWPLVLRVLVFSGTLTGLMTWVVMPRMTRLFRRFLYGVR
jgi:antibiotic biosynthesis monooxygenase (ABM) superfamily enzyme